MCTTCNAKSYGQDQPEARRKDLERLARVRTASARKAEAKNN